jgi:hypothetical protein
VPQGYNSKGLALLIRGLMNLERLEGRGEYLEDAIRLADIIISQKAERRNYFCAGYDFFWEARAFSVPPFTPNMVVSSFCAQAFLDLYEAEGGVKWLDYAVQAGEFIEKELVLFESDREMTFGYVPGEKARIHNVNLMGAALFARLFFHTAEEKYREYAIKSTTHSVDSQRDDGSWIYGDKSHHQWVDNFHTGFNLLALKEIRQFLALEKWSKNLRTGFEYHIENHFLPDMTPKYFDTELYPLDIHNFAQGIVTFLAFGYPDKALKLIEKSVDMMWDRNKHYFYYQKRRWYTNRIDYLRWSQAWMFYALSEYLRELDS